MSQYVQKYRLTPHHALIEAHQNPISRGNRESRGSRGNRKAMAIIARARENREAMATIGIARDRTASEEDRAAIALATIGIARATAPGAAPVSITSVEA